MRREYTPVPMTVRSIAGALMPLKIIHLKQKLEGAHAWSDFLIIIYIGTGPFC